MYENIFKMYKKNSFDSIILIDECVPPNILLEFAEFLLNKKIHTKWMVETRIKEEYLDKYASDADVIRLKERLKELEQQIVKIVENK